MASYKSGFDPPTRPAETSRARRLGTYMQQNAGKQERVDRREEDIAHLQTESRRTAAAGTRSQQTALPRPRMRDPSPSTRPKLEGTKTGSSSSSFGYNRNLSKTSAPANPTPELRGKTSRNVLRRKPSSVAQEETRPKTERQDSSSVKPPPERKASLDQSTRSTEVFTRPARSRTPATQPPPQIYPELDRYRFLPSPPTNPKIHQNPPKLSTQDLPPPTPLLSSSTTPGYSAGSSYHRYSGYSSNGYSASPSTRFSESPGPGTYSRDTTPTSMSSQSPGIIAPSKSTTPNTRLRQASPAFNSNLILNRPPVVSRNRTGSFSLPAQAGEIDAQGLPSLRESITSSSSNSTVKDGASKEKEKKKKKRLSPLPPSPPPRKSSQKFKRSKSLETNELEASPSKPSSAPAAPVMLPSTSSPSKSAQAVKPATNAKPGPPIRPSREGTPDLHAQLGITPVVHSNLTHPPLSHQNAAERENRRKSSLPLPRSAGPSPSPQLRPTRLPARNNPSPSPILLAPREATPAPISASGLGIIPSLPPPSSTSTSNSRNVSRTPSPSVSNPKSRFALFGRRAKTVPEIHGPPLTSQNPSSLTRKGPAAGTGHEGYGKYSASNRGRSASTASSRGGSSLGGSREAGSSQESVATRDDFLKRRMSPVIIAGGGEIRENMNEGSELARTESGTSLERQVSHEASRTTLWPSAMPRERESGIGIGGNVKGKGRRPSDSSDDAIHRQTLGRRSQRFDSASTAESLGLPRPLRIGMGARTMSASTTDLSVLSDESLGGKSAEIGTARKGILTKPRKLEKKSQPKEKEPTSKKWNFFHRSHSKGPEREIVQPSPVPVMVGRPTNTQKVVPHYALLDSSDEQLGDEVDLEVLLRDAEVVAMSNEELDALQFGGGRRISAPAPLVLKTEPKVQTRMDETQAPVFSSPETIQDAGMVHPRGPILFSSPEPMKQTAAKPRVHTPPMQTLFASQEPLRPSTPPQQSIPNLLSPQQTTLHLQTSLHLNQPPARVRPSRLPQVGRIPKVISARPETTSPKSFSRPFARLSTLQPVSKPLIVDEASVALGPSPNASPPKSSTPEPTAAIPSIPVQNAQPVLSQPTIQPQARLSASSEIRESTSSKSDSLKFLAFSPRKGSEATTSSSGGGLSFKDTTAVIPLPDDPLEEDEMWDEYDDLLAPKSPNPNLKHQSEGEIVPVSATSSHGMPFQYEKYESRRARPTRKSEIQERAKEDPAKESPVLTSAPERGSVLTSSSIYSVDMSARLKDALTTIPSPSTPLSFSEFFGGYGDRNLSTHTHQSQSQSQRVSIASSSCISEASQDTGLGLGLSEGLMNSNLMREQKEGREEKGKGKEKMVDLELRTGSMTVGKWLTFGHVLFSPARESMSGAAGAGEQKVLVIDGLGNDDWSFYAAETYPHAHFYNLSPSHPIPTWTSNPTTSPLSPSSTYPSTPANHTQIHFPSFSSSNPSSSSSSNPKFPFKSATFEVVVYRFPPIAFPSIYRHIISEAKRVLKPGGWFEIVVLDLDIAGMGPITRRAVRGLKVGLSRAEGGALNLGSVGDLVGKELVGKRGWEGVRSCVLGVPVANEIISPSKTAVVAEKSLNELLRSSVGGAEEKDKDITKLVARVGRWWFSRCYESVGTSSMNARMGSTDSLSAPGEQGTLFSEDVLNECEEWKSSFKLFVGVARKMSLSSSSTGSGGSRRRGKSF